MIEQADADVLVELSPTDLTTGEPATSHMRAALGRGMHAITANKGPIALHLAELRRLASDAQLYLGYEGTVMSGTPALRLGWSDLAGCEVLELRGIVNGTTNYILTQMEGGMSYADALAEAQRLGYAEADPTGDVEGYDAAAKAVILANVLMDARLGLADVERAGITTLTRDTIEAARDSGERWKLIARVWREGDQVRASVQPTRLPHQPPARQRRRGHQRAHAHHRPARRCHADRARRGRRGDRVRDYFRYPGAAHAVGHGNRDVRCTRLHLTR